MIKIKRRILIVDGISLVTGASFLLTASHLKAENAISSLESIKKKSSKFVLYSSTNKNDDVKNRIFNGLTSSINLGKIFKIDENLKVSDSIHVPAGAKIVSDDKWITQEKEFSPIFICDGPGYRLFERVNCKGLGGDYENGRKVYAAAGIVAQNGATIIVDNCQLINFAGAGVSLMTGAIDCKITRSRITGPGKDFITSKLNNYGACVVVDNYIQNWTIDECDLSNSAQGIVTGDYLANVKITRNRIHDIAGQHGAYIESVRNVVISDNFFFNIPLQGMKIQIGSIKAPSAENIIIEKNRFSFIGSHGVLLTNPVGSTARLLNFRIKDNKFNDIGESAISLNSCSGGTVESNEIQLAARGFYIKDCDKLSIAKNSVRDIAKEGILGVNLRKSSFRENYFYNSLNVSSEKSVGIVFSGSFTEEIEVVLNKMDGKILKKIRVDGVVLSRFKFQANSFSLPGG